MTEGFRKDAAEFGLHSKQGGWRLGLLVARNVKVGTGDGVNKGVVTTTADEKVSARQFAEESGTSTDRVLNHLKAWARAVEAQVPSILPAAELSPGVDIDLDVDSLPAWFGEDGFYRSNRRGDGDSRKFVSDPEQMSKAIQADPKVAAAARAALQPQTAEDKRKQFVELSADEEVTGHNTTRFKAEQQMSEARAQNPMHIKRARAKELQEAQHKRNGSSRWMSAEFLLTEATKKIREAGKEVQHSKLSDEHRELLREQVGQIHDELNLVLTEINDTSSADWDAGLAQITEG